MDTLVVSRRYSRFLRPRFPEGPVDVPQSFRNPLDMRTAEEKRKASRYVLGQLNHRHWDGRRLAIEAGIDEGTVRTFLSGKTWPQAPKRKAIEEALGLTAGTIEAAAAGLFDEEMSTPPAPATDPVEVAIYRSRLTRANQLKLAGIYYEMLEAQDKVGAEVRGA